MINGKIVILSLVGKKESWMKKTKNEQKFPQFMKDIAVRKNGLLILFCQLVMVILAFVAKIPIGIAMSIIFLGTLYLVREISLEIGSEINKHILDLSYRIKRGEQEALIKMPIGIILLNQDQKIEWINPYMQSHLSGYGEVVGNSLEEVEKELAEQVGKSRETGKKQIYWKDKVFKITVEEEIRAIYLMDITEYVALQNEYEEMQPVVGYLFLDNYDELTQGMDDRGISNFDNILTTYLSNWGKQHGIFYKRISDDRYFILMTRRELERLEKERFSIIDSIRERTSKRNVPLTISIGVSYGEAEYDQLSDTAQSNLDLALARGGDQAIVKTIEGEPRYYGGNSNPMEKRTRVRARMISQALRELMVQSDQVFVMGHQNPDFDVIGSSLGIRRFAQIAGKKCWVIVNPEDMPHDVSQLMKEVKKDKNINKNIVTPKEAQGLITEESLVVLVDHHKPTRSIAPDLLKETTKNVVIDHHRRGEEFTKDPLLVYIEPYASSTAELITEFFQYLSKEGETVNKIEATALLGGIIVDTKSFTLRTGSRTFDAASYLQSVGADSSLVQRLLKEDSEVYLTKSKIIETAEYLAGGIAIASGEEGVAYPSVMTAQTADTLLSISGVEASFVITFREDGRVGISARSLGKVNVQLIMEAMGGGGHLSNAATQIEGKTIEEVKKELKQVIENHQK